MNDESLKEDQFLFDHVRCTVSHWQQLRYQILIDFLGILAIGELDDHILIGSVSL